MSLLSRYDAAAELAKTGAQLGAPMLPGGDLTPTHIAAVDVLTSLLDLGADAADDDTPSHMKILITMLRRSRPMLVEGIGKIPPEQIVEFMRGLSAKIDTIIDTAPPAAPTTHADASHLHPDQTTIEDHIEGSADDDHVDDADDPALAAADLAPRG